MQHGSATAAMIRHRYGQAEPRTPAQPQRQTSSTLESIVAATKQTDLNTRQRAILNAGLRFLQVLEANGMKTDGIAARDWSAFNFPLPSEDVIQQIGPVALKAAAKNGTAVTALETFIDGYPNTILIFSDNPVAARSAVQQHYNPSQQRVIVASRTAAPRTKYMR